MEKFYFLLALVLLGSLSSKAQNSTPNILVIIADQHAGTILNQRGYPDLATPGIDKIANNGIMFTKGYCTYPVCQSSRKSMVTGTMASKVDEETQYISIGTKLKDAGYETAYYGKWHVGGTDIDDDKDWHGFTSYQDSHDDTDISSWSTDFIKQTHSNPFFMITSYQNPHDCCELARNIAGNDESYHDGSVEENQDTTLCPQLPTNFAIPPNEAEGFYGRRDNDPGDEYWNSHPTKLWTNVEWRQYLYGYDRLVEKVDTHIEELYDALDTEGLLENTVIIYLSDHGDGHASHNWNQKKSFYEESVNIPFVVSWKGKTKTGVIDNETLVSSGLDIYPTVLKLAGIAIPETLLGVDLTPAFLLDATDNLEARDYVVSETEQKIYKGHTPGTFIGRMVVTQSMKYILFDRGVNREQLFDIANDPEELNPVTDNPDYADELASCRQMLKDWVVKADDKIDVDAIISEYEANSSIDAIQVNGETLSDFNPDSLNYTLRLKYTDKVEVTATAINSGSSVIITQATNLWGSEAERTVLIEVVSEDKNSTSTYSVVLDVDAYLEPETNAFLDEILINGAALEGFDSDVLYYDITLNYTNEVNIEATPLISDATVTIQNPINAWGDESERLAQITVVSKDGSVTQVYKIQVSVSNVIFRTGFFDEGTDVPEDGWEVKYSMISENVPGPGNHGLYDGPAAYKFVRGQSDKQGYLKTSFYENMDSLSFWMFVDSPDNSAKLEIESKTASNSVSTIGTITGDELLATAWSLFSFAIDKAEATQLIFTPTTPTDGDTRLWIDDLTITGQVPELTITDTTTRVNCTKNTTLSIYPNPVTDFVAIDNYSGVINRISICNLEGQIKIEVQNISNNQPININSLSKGIYLMRVETSSNVSVLKFVKK